MAPSAKHRVLHQIFCDPYITRQTHCGPQQRTQMHERELLKLFLPRIAYDLYRFLAKPGMQSNCY
jgi:hypothetical protein